MARFVLETYDWTDYVVDRSFVRLHTAIEYGEGMYAQNDWRVIDETTREVVHQHNAFEVIQEDAMAEANRFEETARWRNIFADRAESQARQLQWMQNVAARQRVRVTIVDNSSRFFDDLVDEESVCVEEKINWLKEGF